MAYEIEIFADQNLALITHHGYWSANEAPNSRFDLIKRPDFVSSLDILRDARGVSFEKFGAEDIAQQTANQSARSQNKVLDEVTASPKIAWIFDPDQQAHRDVVEALLNVFATEHTLRQVFTDPAKALKWLGLPRDFEGLDKGPRRAG